MPWSIGSKKKKGYPVISKDSGKTVGYTPSKAKAQENVRERYKNIRKGSLSTKGKNPGGNKHMSLGKTLTMVSRMSRKKK